MPRAPIAEIKAHAVDKLDLILDKLAKGGRYVGRTYTVRNPTRKDNTAGSFVVYTRGHMAGAFVEFANREEEKGDVIDLVSYLLNGGVGFKERAARGRAIEWIADLVGLARMPHAARATALEAANKRRLTDEEAEAALAAKRARAYRMWMEAEPITQGCEVTRYLASRGIDLRLIPNLETELRYSRRLEWWLGAQREGSRKVAPGPFYPAIVAAMREATGQVMAVHCTFLAPDGSGKAPVARPKLIWPEYSGCVIRLCRGAGNLTPEDATTYGLPHSEDPLRGPCILTEGIEDGLTEALGCRGEHRVWAAGSLANLANVPALPCVDGWMLVKQNDWHSRQALEQFERAKLALEAGGRPVAEIATFGRGKDPNDMLRGKS